TVLPAVLYLLDRHKLPTPRRKIPGLRLAAPLARLSAARPRLLLGAGLLATALALVVLPRYLSDPFEYDFRNLRTLRSQGRSWHSRIDSVLGRTLSPQPILLDDVADAPLGKQAIFDRDRALPPPRAIHEVVTAFDLLPGDPLTQQRKIAALREIHQLLKDPTL